jgi:hypothetical protein
MCATRVDLTPITGEQYCVEILFREYLRARNQRAEKVQEKSIF